MFIIFSQVSNAAIALQQSRMIFDGDKSSTRAIVNNQNILLPYLAQGWIEDENGKRVQGPLQRNNLHQISGLSGKDARIGHYE